LNFDWIVEGQVAAMAKPWPEDVAELRRRGITAVLSLTERAPSEIEAAGIAVLALPVRDFHAPTMGQLEAAVEYIERTVESGGACAVHCGAGLGRTGTVVAAWLVRRGRDARGAIAEVRRRRPGSIETSEQESAVLAFAKQSAARHGERSA
jgi:atypical dual specificity phosphatase